MALKEGNGVTAWSYSRLSDYQQCPAKFKYKHIDKLSDPPGPAMARGVEMHKLAEDYFNAARKPRKPPAGFERFAHLLSHWRGKKTQAEKEVVLGKNWSAIGNVKASRLWFHPEAWLRVKMDVYRRADAGATATIADWKTGKRYSAHNEQAELYGLAALVASPELNEAVVHMCYVDQKVDNHSVKAVFREDVPELVERWSAKIAPMFNDTKFAMKPGPLCGWCAYSRAKGGPCAH